ncbi:MAG: NAD(P)-binding domain-containing protein [Dorea sp.]
MITKKLGIIGCGNMGGAILYGALESGVIAKENVYVYDINPRCAKRLPDGVLPLQQMTLKYATNQNLSFLL